MFIINNSSDILVSTITTAYTSDISTTKLSKDALGTVHFKHFKCHHSGQSVHSTMSGCSGVTQSEYTERVSVYSTFFEDRLSLDD